MLLLRIAWRNLGRQPRRTALTSAAAVFAVVLTLITLAAAAGSHDRWVEHIVRLYPGHVEVMAQGYRDHRTLDYGMTLSEAQTAALDRVPGIDGWAPRLEAWALAIPDRDDSTGRAAQVIGLDPAREGPLTRIGRFVREGGLLSGEPEERNVVLGRRLAENLGVAAGDSVILLAADYYGSQSAERFRVAGTLEVGDDTIDGYAAIVDLDDLRRFVEYPGGLSHVAAFASDPSRVEAVRAELDRVFSRDAYEVLTWPELLPDLYQLIVLDDLGGYLTLSVLLVVVAFGLLNTILMSVLERVREFGVMRAMGVRPRRIFGLVVIEALLMSAIGLVIGFAIGIPLTLWLEQHPIQLGDDATEALELFGVEALLVFRLHAGQLVLMAGVLVGVALLAALPPAFRASRGRPVDALREA
jgi:ABC-type lipoprotein release transport system permease subunit